MEPVIMRAIERILAVLIGGLSVYLGYNLFLHLPEQTDSAGKIILPGNISIYLSRVGPGVFFALFGVVVVALSLHKAIIYSEPGNYIRDIIPATGRYYSGLGETATKGGRQSLGQTARADARALLRKEIARLNTIPLLLPADLPEHERVPIERSIASIKFLLIKPVWGDSDEGFGDIAEFERWVDAGEPNPPPAGMEGALALYRYGTKEPSP